MARVWILQPRVEHYRTPVFDGLLARGRADKAYELTVLGTLQDGRAFGGESRAYFRSCPREDFRRLGMSLCRWPDAEERVASQRPDVLILEANIRNTTAWTLPRRCHDLGIAVMGWSKVQSVSRVAPLSELLKPRFHRRFDWMICYGDSSAADLRHMGYPSDRICVARNTIDTTRIFYRGEAIAARAAEIRRERGLGAAKILLCVGRMDPEKRHDDLLEAWPRLRQLDRQLVLALVGSGPREDEIRARARALDPERVLVTGRVPEGDDYAWIAASEVCVYPGSVGLAINQTLALGRPTIIADEPGPDAEILVGEGPEQTGWRYERGNAHELVNAVRGVLGAPEEARRVCERGRALMRDQVTLEKMVDAMDACIRSALNRRAAATRN